MTRRPMEAAGTVDAQNAPTAPWKIAQTAISHSYHRRSHRNRETKVLPMLPVNFVTYLPGRSRSNCTQRADLREKRQGVDQAPTLDALSFNKAQDRKA